MTVRELRELISKFEDDQQVILVRGSRIGHDDARRDFSVKEGFASEEFGDVRLEKGVLKVDDFDEVEGDMDIDFKNPVCLIVT